MYVDTHLHLADSQFGGDRDAVIDRALQAGVKTFVEIAESPASWDAAVALADRYPFFYASLGIHPHLAHEVTPENWPALRRRLLELLKNPKVVAVGEFGLDYFRMRNTKEQQAFLYKEQLEVARESGKPIVIHCREGEPGQGGAHADIQEQLMTYYPKTSIRMECPAPHGVIHCFSGTWTDAQTYMEHGFMLGVDGPVSYPSAKLLQENVVRMPLQRLVLETDSPYLPPQSHRGQRNEPSHIPGIAEAIATLKKRSTAEVATSTTENARALFRL